MQLLRKKNHTNGVFTVDQMKIVLLFTLSDSVNAYTIENIQNYTLLHLTEKFNQ